MSALKPLFEDIASAIREKDGTDEPIYAADFPARIREISVSNGPYDPLDPISVYRATRPADWLPMPEPQDNELYILLHVPDGLSGLVAFTVTCTGEYTVEQGTMVNGVFMGRSSSRITSGEKYEAELLADDWEDHTSEGYKQVMIRVSGEDILTWEPSTHGKKGYPANYRFWPIKEIRCKLPKGERVQCGSGSTAQALQQIRYFSWLGENNVTSAQSMFCGCTALVAVTHLYTGKAKSTSCMFLSCYALVSVPEIDMGQVENAAEMFSGCQSLLEEPVLRNFRATTASQIFNGCLTLREVKKLDVSKSENILRMFGSCYALTSVLGLNISSGRNTAYMFTCCNALSRITFDPTVVDWSGLDIDLTYCVLGHSALVELMESLPAITETKTITLTGNPGAADLTENEKAIASAKNWTLVL